MAPAMSRAEAEAHLRQLQEAYASEIRQAYADAERIMLEKVAKRIERGIDRPGWAEQKLAEIHALNDDIGNVVADLRKLDPRIIAAIEDAYQSGAAMAAAELIKAKLPDITADIAYTRGAGIRTLIGATTDALNSTHLRILRTTNDAYRQVISRASAQVLTGTQTRRQAAQSALNAFADRGIDGFVDSAGRHWEIQTYAETATRSATAQASIQGHIDKLDANDRDLVIVSDSPEECDLCRVWEGKVLSITGKTPNYPTVDDATADGLFHANCTHTVHIYIEGLTREYTNTENPEGYAERQQQRYNERMIRQWKRREAVAIEPQDKQMASNKVRQWQDHQKKFIDETGRRRKYERESIKGKAR